MNKFVIDNVEFTLKDSLDLTGNESEELQKMFSGVFAENSNTVNAGNFSNDEMKRFLIIVLAPVKGSLSPNFDWGKYTQKTALEVISAFFLETIKQKSIMEKYLIGLTKQQTKRFRSTRRK